MKAIIFGINGQDGHYLSELLSKNNIELVGVSRHSGKWLLGDVGDPGFVESLIKTHLPEYIFHFAANSSTKHEHIFENQKTIVSGTFNILESVKKYSPQTKIFLSGSAMQFKNTGIPIDESTPFYASSAYALARIQSVYAGRYYRDVYGLKVYVGYLFHHDSPLRSEQHLSKIIVSTVKRIAGGSKEILNIGNINIKKEFNYAKDIVKAIWILVNQDKVVEAVIGSGEAYRVKDWVKYCFNKVGLNWEEFISIKPGFIPEYTTLVSNPKLIKRLGWEPKINIYQLADLMME